MIFRWYRPNPQSRSIARLYGAIVAQARAPAFYRIYLVPDTVNGRLEMLMLHLSLVLDRLKLDAANAAIGQALFDEFCSDMDASMREMGVGDLAVPRKMRRVGAAYYNRQAAYGSALAADTAETLVALLGRHVFAGKAEGQGVARLATYTRETVHLLWEQNQFSQGRLTFPDPDKISGDA